MSGVSITTNATLAPGAAGSPYTTSLAATGGTGTYAWTITSGALPPGLNWSNGIISGTPTAAAVAGTYSFTAQAADTQNATASKTFSISVLAITTTRLLDAIVNRPYSSSLSAVGGSSPSNYSWSGSLSGGSGSDPLLISSAGTFTEPQRRSE